MKETTKQRMKVAGSLFAGGASVAALLWVMRNPQHEGPISVQCPQNAPCPTAPAQGDGKCEVSKGEADPASPTFDPASCGYCGDGIRQVMTTASIGGRPREDEATGVRVQDVTERPSETPETCPFDFHCGNGKQDRNEPYAAWQQSISDAGTLTFSLVHVTENSQDCARDFRNTRRPRNGGEEDTQEDPIPTFQTGQVWSCPSQVASTDSSEIVASQSGMLQSIIRRVAGIRARSPEIRTALHVSDPDMRVTVSVSLLVDSSGSISVRDVSASCGGSPCGDQATILNASQLSLSGLYMPSAPGTQCLWTHNVILMRGDSSPAPASSGTLSPKPGPK